MTFRLPESRFAGWSGSGSAPPTWSSGHRNSPPELRPDPPGQRPNRTAATSGRLTALLVRCGLAGSGHHGFGYEAGIGANRVLYGLAGFRLVLQERLGVLSPLANALAVVGKPGAGLFDDAGLNAKVNQLAAFRDALAEHDIEIDDLERRCHLVLDDLYARLVADHLVTLLDRTDAPDVEADRGIEFQGVAAGRGLRIAEHHTDLVADLVDKDHHGAGTGDRARQPAPCLAHQPGVQTHMAVAHLAFELGARHQGCHRIDDQHVDRARTDEGVRDLQRLLAGIRLGDQQIVYIDAELAGIGRVERVLGIDKGTSPAAALRLGDDV